jgi:pimeloyl-ACP methyl ester carboxylesterase
LIGGGGIPISVSEFEAVSVVSALNGSVSIYVTDKRGVGQSSLLECPSSIFLNFSNCLSYIKENEYRLKHNTFTNMARDLYYVLKIISNRQYLNSNQRIILMGSSQGTYLLQRYLHLIENEKQIDGIILDSVVPTDFNDLIKYDKYADYVFLDLFLRCAQDKEGCANKFEDQNPLRALYTYKINEDIQGNLSCLSLLNTNTIEIGIKVRIKYLNSNKNSMFFI